MLNQSVLKMTSLQSPLLAASALKPKQNVWKKGLAADLLLTALIDAFSILVIFLLMSFSSTGEILFINKGMELPKASKAEVLDRNPVVKIDEGKIYLEDKLLTAETLISELLDIRKKFSAERPGEEFHGTVTVQADRRIKYEFLNQIILACAHAGFSDLRFAVTMK